MKPVTLGSILLAAAMLSTACTNFSAPAKVTRIDPREHGYWFQYSAGRRGATSVPKSQDGSGIMLCAEPVPDVALEHTNSVLAKVDIPESASAEVKAEFASSVVQLAGRTQTVLLLREAMYRLCEQSINGNIGADAVAELFKSILETTILMGRADVLTSGAKLKPDAATKQEILDLIAPTN